MNPGDNSPSLAGSTVKKTKGTHGGARKGSGRKPKAVKSQILGTACAAVPHRDVLHLKCSLLALEPLLHQSFVPSTLTVLFLSPIRFVFSGSKPVILVWQCETAGRSPMYVIYFILSCSNAVIHIMYSNGSTVSKHVRRQSCSPQ